jgi:flagellar hook-associated protein 1
MGLPNVFQTGRSGMVAAKAGIATSGHNISNARTEGASRQRVLTEADRARPSVGSRAVIGTGVQIGRVERVNDQYLEKQIRDSNRTLAHHEEKDVALHQLEDIFNEMNGDGLNRLISRFYNEFRKLSNDPDNEAVRQSVREASQSLVNDFHRLRKETEELQNHIDSRLEGYVKELNAAGEELKDLNTRIRAIETGGAPPNDLLDKRDVVLKKIASYVDVSMHVDKQGSYVVDLKGIGPYVVGPEVHKFYVERSPADDQGKRENAFDLKTSASVSSIVTHRVPGGKLGALLEVRDKTLSTIQDRLDDLAYGLSQSTNAIHEMGFTRHGAQGIQFFKALDKKEQAAAHIGLSQDIQASVNNIAAAAIPDAPGDGRIAIALSGLQSQRLMSDGKATMDDWYNAIVSDVGVASAANKSAINQQQDIMVQLGKMRDNISGISIDEETANLMQFQHLFGASAHVIKVADEMLKTVLELRSMG